MHERQTEQTPVHTAPKEQFDLDLHCLLNTMKLALKIMGKRGDIFEDQRDNPNLRYQVFVQLHVSATYFVFF